MANGKQYSARDIVIESGNGNFSKIARLHAEAITEGFLTTLGLRFLSALYAAISRAPRSGVLVAYSGDSVVGFAAYAANLSECYKWVLTHRFLSLATALLPNMLRPSIYKRMTETLLYPLRSHKEAKEEKVRRPRAELMAIAVSAAVRGRGVGKSLVHAVDQQFERLNVSEYCVVTHGVDGRSMGFYTDSGFEFVRRFTNHGKPMVEYIRRLPAQSDRVQAMQK